LLKWDRQEKTYYPIEINIFQKLVDNIKFSYIYLLRKEIL